MANANLSRNVISALTDMVRYTCRFYRKRSMAVLESARNIVPLLVELVNPASVVDVGCARGEFLSVFIEHGIKDILGIDGPWIAKENLLIPEANFIGIDISKPFLLNRKFDLVLCLEVAEHLPRECAITLIENLTHLGDIILFSAAVPLQNGIGHLNEQWPAYWRKIFNMKNYKAVDCLRGRLWEMENINFCYAQNSIFYIRKDCPIKSDFLQKISDNKEDKVFAIIHPRLYLEKAKKVEILRRFVPSWIKRILDLLLK